MTQGEADNIKKAVKEAVHEQLPETLGEVLSPMIRRTVKDVLRPFKREVRVGYVLLCVAIALLYAANRERVNDIQDQRKAFCIEQNTEHDNTEAEIERQVAERKKKLTPRAAANLEQRKNDTLVLIDALAPKRDCDKVINQE